MINTGYSLALIGVMAGVTALIRFLPFLVFRKGAPGPVLFLGEVLPYAVMGMLVVYCLKNINVFIGNHGLPDILAVAFVAVLHKWKHNTLLSIAGGTIFYMVLVQFIF